MDIYDKVKSIADSKGLSIAEVERKAGQANGTIGKWKNGEARITTLLNVADALEVGVEELLTPNKQ